MFTLRCCNKILPYFRNWVSIHFFVFKHQNHFEFPKDGKWSPRLKILEIPGGRGGGSSKTPWNGKSWGVGGANQKVFRGGGMDIFWNHTMFMAVQVH